MSEIETSVPVSRPRLTKSKYQHETVNLVVSVRDKDFESSSLSEETGTETKIKTEPESEMNANYLRHN